MKKLVKLFFVVFCLALLACRYDDDGSYQHIEIQDAIVFENNQNYVVGDTLFFELNFSRYLDEAGFSNKLDIYESTGSDSFYYDFGLNKFSELSGGFRRIGISDEFIFAEKGSINGGVIAQLNQEKTQYESRVGIVLAEAGRFELDFDNLRLSRYVRINDDYPEDKIYIDLKHISTVEPLSFEFNVTE